MLYRIPRLALAAALAMATGVGVAHAQRMGRNSFSGGQRGGSAMPSFNQGGFGQMGGQRGGSFAPSFNQGGFNRPSYPQGGGFVRPPSGNFQFSNRPPSHA